MEGPHWGGSSYLPRLGSRLCRPQSVTLLDGLLLCPLRFRLGAECRMSGKLLHQNLTVMLVVITVEAQADQPDPKGILFIGGIHILRLDALLCQRHLVHGNSKPFIGFQVIRIRNIREAIESDTVFPNMESKHRVPMLLLIIFQKGFKLVYRMYRCLIQERIHQILFDQELTACRFGNLLTPGVDQADEVLERCDRVVCERQADAGIHVGKPSLLRYREAVPPHQFPQPRRHS